MLKSTPRESTDTLAVVSGGSGGEVLADTLRHLPIPAEFYTILTDSGGSSRDFRQDGAPGDMRKIIARLIDDPELGRAFNHRFTNGPFKGHAAGNPLLAALAASHPDGYDGGGDVLYRSLHLRCPVYPVSAKLSSLGEHPHLRGTYSNGATFDEESQIDDCSEELTHERIVEASLDPPIFVNPRLVEGIQSGRIKTMTFGPGSLWGSIIAALLVTGLKEAIDMAEDLVLVYVCNMATMMGETTGLDVTGHLTEINRHLGQHKIDVMIVSQHTPSAEMMEQYRSKGQELLLPTKDELASLPCTVIANNFFTPGQEGEARHDSYRLSAELLRIVYRDY